MSRRYRGRRRGVYMGPAMVLAGILVIMLGIFLVFLATREKGQMTDGQQDDAPPAEELQEEFSLPDHATTASGISCALTDLEQEAIHSGELILVNNWTSYHFPEEQELVCVYEKKSDGYYVRDLSVFLAPVAMDAMDRMLVDFRTQGGSKSINVVAGYRTREDQQHLFDQSAERNGREHAERYVAKPGGSEHHTGMAVDFSILQGNGVSADYDGTGEYAWINSNCHRYGFVVRYAQDKADLTGIWDEPWHFRYVGVPHATEMGKQAMCMEEYMDYLKKFPFDGEHLTIDCDTGSYEVWYTEGTQVYLPESGEYQLSGNNTDGVIVTCKIG